MIAEREGMLFRKKKPAMPETDRPDIMDGTYDSDMDAVMKNEIIKPHRPLDAFDMAVCLIIGAAAIAGFCSISGIAPSDVPIWLAAVLWAVISIICMVLLDYAKNRKIAKRNFEIEKGIDKINN